MTAGDPFALVRPKRARPAAADAGEVPLDHLIECRDYVARLIAGGRPEALPIFERIEAEIAARERKADALARALAIAAEAEVKARP